VISGERETHDHRIKLNQIDVALEAYEQFMQEFSIELLLPLRKIVAGAEIEGILGEDWEEGEKQVRCVLSQNYQAADGSVSYDETAVRTLLAHFVMPLARELLQAHLGEQARSPSPPVSPS
jgi:hypothetical protein